MVFMHVYSEVFHILMVLSVDPPPVARMECWWGDHANALTAAECSINLDSSLFILKFHKHTQFSFPPEAK